LSSYSIYFLSQPIFSSFYALAPLFFLGMEKYLKENKKILFIITVPLLLLTDYYLFFTISIFAPIYFIYRYYNINKTLNGFVLSALKLIGYYLIGVLISGAFILPSFLYIMQNDRVGGFSLTLFFDDLLVYLHLLVGSFVPSQTYIYGNNIFEQQAHTLKELCLYSSTLVTLLVPQVFVDKDKEFKKSTIILYIVLLLILFIPFGNSIMHGFSETCFRWSFLFITMNLLVFSKYYLDFKNINKVVLKKTGLIESIIIIVSMIAALIYKNENIINYLKQSLIFLCSIILLVTFIYLINKKQEKKIIVVLFIELALFSYLNGVKSVVTGDSKETVENVSKVLADDIDNLNYVLNTLEEGNSDSFFRVYVPYDSVYWSYSKNFNLIYNLKGLMTYDSTYAPSFSDMRGLAPDKIIDYIDWEYSIKDPDIINFLSTKYSITTTIDEIPFNNYSILKDDYRGSLIIAKNEDYRPFGTTYNKVMTYSELKDKYNNDTSKLNDYVVTNEDYDEISSLVGGSYVEAYDVYNYNNALTLKIDSNDDSFMIISLPYDEGWTIKVNGEITNYYKVNGGMTGFKINSGYNEVEMYFMPSGFKVGFVMSVIGVGLFVAVFIKSRKSGKKI